MTEERKNQSSVCVVVPMESRAYRQQFATGERWWKKVDGEWFSTADHKGPFVGPCANIPAEIVDQHVAAMLAAAPVSPDTNRSEVNRLKEIKHAAWHALEAAEEREGDCLVVPWEEGMALSKLLPVGHPNAD